MKKSNFIIETIKSNVTINAMDLHTELLQNKFTGATKAYLIKLGVKIIGNDNVDCGKFGIAMPLIYSL